MVVLLSVMGFAAHADTAMARGADISWCTEMEAAGKKFYNSKGVETDIFALMKEIGMTAIRLRVWVNPSGFGYGAWCDKADVLAKAKRAHEQGLDLLIDFHYSDFFADPGTQTKPKDWYSYTFAQLKTAVADHTTDVLTALRDAGIEPKWVQVGNETNLGMIWNNGKIDWNQPESTRFSNYAALSNAGYDAVKAVFPNAKVILHLANAYKAADSDGWFFSEFKRAGGKFDIIGLSHYPDWTDWQSSTAGKVSNVNAAKSIESLGKIFGVPVMLVETGYDSYDAVRAKNVMQDLFDRLTPLACCAGIFYWEPEVDGVWKPDYYNSKGWNAYKMGAFTTSGRPTVALDPFKGSTDAIETVGSDDASAPVEWFDLQGRRLNAPAHGINIRKQGSHTGKVAVP